MPRIRARGSEYSDNRSLCWQGREGNRIVHLRGAQVVDSRKAILGLSSCMALYMTAFVIILPLFARRFDDLGAGVEALGISAMAYALAGTVAAPMMGALADRLGRRPLVIGSLAVNAAALGGYLFAPSAAAFIVLRGLAGTLTAGLVPAVMGLVADLAPTDRRAQWIGYVNAGASFGWIVGPIAGGLLYDAWGYSVAVLVSIVMAIIALLVGFACVPGSRLASGRALVHAQRTVVDRSFPKAAHAWRDLCSTLPESLSSLGVLLFISFAVLFAWSFIEPRFMFYAYNDLDWSSSTLGLMMSAYGVALMLGEISLGRSSDRVGRKPVILAGLILFSAQFIGLACFTHCIPIAVTFVLGGLGNGLYDPALNASILDISPAEHRSRILGIKSMVGSCGSILGPALVALLNSSVDARGIFLISVGVVLLTALVALAWAARARYALTEPALDAGTGKQVTNPTCELGEV